MAVNTEGPAMRVPQPVTVTGGSPHLTIDNEARPAILAALLRLSVDHRRDQIGRCELRFGLPELELIDGARDHLDVDRHVEVALPSGTDRATVLTGRVNEIGLRHPGDAPPELLVTVEDDLRSLQAVRRTRSFLQMSDADVVAQIAGEHGLGSDLDLSGPVRPLLVQHDRTDLAFVRERVRTMDARLWMQGSVLVVRPDPTIGIRPRDRIVLRTGVSLLRAELTSSPPRSVTGWVTASGDAALRVGTLVDLDGLDGRFDGTYDVTAVQHTIDLERPYRTRIAVQRTPRR